jgi:hypothetical protein
MSPRYRNLTTARALAIPTAGPGSPPQGLPPMADVEHAGYGTVTCLVERGARMTLFVAIHQHAPQRCPAGVPAMGPMLLNHLSTANAAKYGVSIQAEAVANDKHTLYLIADAGDEEHMSQFLAPFAQVGSVELLPASSCEVVINRGGCAQVPA